MRCVGALIPGSGRRPDLQPLMPHGGDRSAAACAAARLIQPVTSTEQQPLAPMQPLLLLMPTSCAHAPHCSPLSPVMTRWLS